jgi:hypothetical protein
MNTQQAADLAKARVDQAVTQVLELREERTCESAQ